MALLKEFDVGDSVCYTSRNWEAIVGCIHKNSLYLKGGPRGTECEDHGTFWRCEVLDNGHVSANSSDYEKLIIVKKVAKKADRQTWGYWSDERLIESMYEMTRKQLELASLGPILIPGDIPTKEKNMQNVVTFFKNMALDADTKLLREMGLEDAMGNATETGFRLSAELLYKASRAEIVAIAKEMKAEADKDKK